jgi:hypothetical protein
LDLAVLIKRRPSPSVAAFQCFTNCTAQGPRPNARPSPGVFDERTRRGGFVRAASGRSKVRTAPWRRPILLEPPRGTRWKAERRKRRDSRLATGRQLPRAESTRKMADRGAFAFRLGAGDEDARARRGEAVARCVCSSSRVYGRGRPAAVEGGGRLLRGPLAHHPPSKLLRAGSSSPLRAWIRRFIEAAPGKDR